MSKCRICNGVNEQIINFGKIALVGNFFKKSKNLKKYKISLNYCKKCKHVQIREILNPDLLFRNYLWETGVSKSNMDLIDDLSKKIKKFQIKKESKVLEIASNDGTLLSHFKEKFKCYVIGVDPAKNLKNEKIFTVIDYFNLLLSKKIKKKFKTFDFIIARNVIAHVSNPNEIFSGVHNLLTEKGVFIVEVPHLKNIIEQNQYDNIFHEHIGFHSLKSIIDLSKKNNLKVFNVEKIDSQGGSIRCYICKKNYKRTILKKVKTMLDNEKKIGLFSPAKLKKFKFKIMEHISNLTNLIENLKKLKKNVSVYGASGKGQALLQFCKLDNKKIDFVFDKSKLKEGSFTPGTNIKILNPTMIKKINPDFLLLLSWNLKKEILNQEKKFIKKGGKFITPFPNPKIIK